MTDRSSKNRSGRVTQLPQRRSRFSIFKLALSSCIMFVIALFAVITVQSVHQYQLQRKLAEHQAKIEQDRKRNERLEAEIQKLQEQDYIEQLARDRLGLVKPGELVFLLEH